MTVDVGRLLCVGIRGAVAGDALLEQDLEACEEAGGVGGVILFDVDVPTLRRLQAENVDPREAVPRAPRNVLDPGQLRELVGYLRSRLGEELLVCVDQEGGRVARLSPNRGFTADPAASAFARLLPGQRRAAAMRQATQLRDLGFDLNFAPCVDLALEEASEIIAGSGRSFGREPEIVVSAAEAVLDAHAAVGLAACLKHFPGHGSSRGDTHQGMVDVTGTWQRDVELEPYRRLCSRDGVAVMVAHVLHRHLDPDLPASLSPAVIEGLLRGELGFDGVVVTDSIDMRAVADRFGPAEAAVAAVEAGADLVIDGFNLEARTEHPAPLLAAALADGVHTGRISPERIDASLSRLDRLRVQIGRAR